MLDARYAFGRHLDAEVAARYHDAVWGVKYLIEIVDALLILYFGYDLDRAVVGVEYLLYVVDIAGAAYKGVGYEVDAEVYGVAYVGAVALRERGQRYAGSRYVYALAWAQPASVLRGGCYAVAVYAVYEEVYLSVVYQEVVAGLDVVCYVGVAQVYRVAGGDAAGVACESHFVARSKLYGHVVEVGCGAYLGTFGVHEYGYGWRHGPNVFYYFTESVELKMGRIHSHHIQAVVVKGLYKFFVTSLVWYRSDYLGKLLHNLSVNSQFATCGFI